MLLRATIEGTKTEDVCDNSCRSIVVVLPSFGVQHLRMLLRYLVEREIRRMEDKTSIIHKGLKA